MKTKIFENEDNSKPLILQARNEALNRLNMPIPETDEPVFLHVFKPGIKIPVKVITLNEGIGTIETCIVKGSIVEVVNDIITIRHSAKRIYKIKVEDLEFLINNQYNMNNQPEINNNSLENKEITSGLPQLKCTVPSIEVIDFKKIFYNRADRFFGIGDKVEILSYEGIYTGTITALGPDDLTLNINDGSSMRIEASDIKRAGMLKQSEKNFGDFPSRKKWNLTAEEA